VPDIFDEFLDELKRRQAGQGDASSEPGEGRPPGPRRQRQSPPNRSGDGGDGGRDQPPVRPRVLRRDRPPARRWPLILAALGLVLLLFLSIGVGFWTDVLWYRSVGFESVLWTRVVAVGGLFLLGTAVALVVLLGNLALAARLSPPGEPGSGGGLGDIVDRMNRAAAARRGWDLGPRPVAVERDALPDLTPAATLAIVGIAVLVALTMGGALATSWETVLLWLHRVPFAPSGQPVNEPFFGKDISWFLFDLPFFRAIQSVFNSLVVASLLVAGGRYLAGLASRGLRVPTSVRVHLAVLAGLYLLSVAIGYQLDKYELVYSSRMPLHAIGVSYTDAHAQVFAYDLLTAISAFAAAFLVGAAFTRWTWPLGLTIAAWFLASIVVGRIYPEAIQRFTVDPNPLVQEGQFLSSNIAMTRLAYGVTGWAERPYTGDAPLERAQIDEDAATFRNARLWDYRPLGDTLNQLQTIRRYYGFVDVDTDRYEIDGKLRQVMLSGRELDLAGNDKATGWLNQRIIYTHGIGAAMVPVNEVTAEGQPVLFIKNLPPVSSEGAPTIGEPRIYFGEKDNGYVIVRAQQPEFDYPQSSSGGTDVGITTRWTGTTGISLDSTLNRVLFALRFGDLDLLISNQVTADSEVLMHRTLDERLRLLAPFLRYDKDPYIVVGADGRLVYIQDAFTISDRFPNAQDFDPHDLGDTTGLGGARFDYIRNSVKIVMDAYDGTMRFYVADPSDPLIRDYAAIFPELFSPMSALPADLGPHLRYPEELFNVQARMYGSYHVTDPATFYSTNDQWTIPSATTSTQSLPSEAYYVVMRIPGEDQPEFLLLQPMVPAGRLNMISWVAARNDAPNYGGVEVFRFPADTTILGPAQIEARIDQDPTISAQFSLWDQAGSKVIRGNLIVVPVGDALIYLQPVYLQSTSSKFPEFQRIIVASPSTVVWGRTLSESLNLLLAGGQPGPSPTPGGTPGPSAGPTPVPSVAPGLPGDIAGLIAYANEHFELAQQALRDGDFARYGQEIELVRQALARLDQLAGPTPSP
jgi:uncharacterized membrane protein (UPF0182 family)